MILHGLHSRLQGPFVQQRSGPRGTTAAGGIRLTAVAYGADSAAAGLRSFPRAHGVPLHLTFHRKFDLSDGQQILHCKIRQPGKYDVQVSLYSGSL